MSGASTTSLALPLGDRRGCTALSAAAGPAARARAGVGSAPPARADAVAAADSHRPTRRRVESIPADGFRFRPPPRSQRVLAPRRRLPCAAARRAGARSSACPPWRSPTTARWRAPSSSTSAARDDGRQADHRLELYVATDRHGARRREGALRPPHAAGARRRPATRTSSSSPPRAYLEGYYYKPRADWELLERHNDGPHRLTGCMSGRASLLLREGNDAAALAEVERLVELFGRDNVYVELQDAGLAEQRELAAQARRCSPRRPASRPWPPTTSTTCATTTPAPTTPCSASRRSASSTSPKAALRMSTDEFYLKTAEEMRELFADYPEACDATLEIAERCDVELDFGRTPAAALPGARRPRRGRRTCASSARQGMRRRYGAEPAAGGARAPRLRARRRSARWASPPTS